MQSHPPSPTPPKAITSSNNPAPEQPGFKPTPDAAGAPSGRRRIPPPGTVEPSPEPPIQEAPAREAPPPRGPSTEEVEADPLVKTVLDIFEGEIKRVHPKN